MREEITDFLYLLEHPPAQEGEALRALALSLDRLAFAIHSLPEGDVPDDAREPPDLGVNAEYKRFSALASKAFPALGIYVDCDPTEDISQRPTMGDAIDDLADIAQDLSQSVWRWDHNGLEDAAWHLRFDYGTHWGEHLHSLRRYLHVLVHRG